MSGRLTFLAITAFWVTMNVLLWRAEYGLRGSETPVPVEIVWRKILTAPDASSLSVYQRGERTGYCEFSTSVGQEMAAMDIDKLPPEGLVKRAGYQIHLAGNLAFGDFTNRLKFDGRVKFYNAREWRELAFMVSTRAVQIEIRAQATNETVQVKLTTEAGTLERQLPISDLQDPDMLARTFLGSFAEPLLDALDLPDVTAMASSQTIEWTACRTRVKITSEPVPVYQMETSLLGHQIVVDVGTLGEILRVRLPGDFTAQIDEWAKP
jgi:hypothetical protein